MNVLDPKDPNTPTRYAIDVRRTAIATMRRDWPYEPGEVARAPLHTGWYYECVEAGETASSWPVFPRAAGETLRDGSVLWQTRHPSEVSLPSIASVEWFIDPPGELAVQAEEISNGILYPLLTGGRDGQRYELTARVEWSPTGQVEDVTVIIPVAHR